MASEMIQTDSLAPVGKMNDATSRLDERRLLGAYALAIAYVVVSAGGVLLAPVPSGLVDMALLFGVVLGHNTCANLWMDLGTGSYRTRCNWGVTWLVLMVVVYSIRAAWAAAAPWETVPVFALFIGIALLIQGVLIRVLLWSARVCFGTELAIQTPEQTGGTRVQFGIAALMAFTAMLGVVFAAGQGFVQLLYVYDVLWQSPAPLFLFLTTAAVVVTLPVAAAILLGRHAAIAAMSAALFVAGVTVVELSILHATNLAHSNGFNLSILAWTNAISSLVVLAYALGLRFFGFRLTMGAAGAAPAH